MFETSKDVLFIVLAICIAAFTFFVCWVLYYGIKAFKEIHETATHIRQKIDEFEAAIERKKQKLENSLHSLNFISQAVKTITEYIIKRKFRDEEKDTSKKKK